MNSRISNHTFHFRSVVSLAGLLFAGAVILFVGSGCNEPSSTADAGDGLNIELQLTGSNSSFVYLAGFYGDQYFTVDSFAVNTDGRCLISRPQPLKQGLYYLAPNVDQVTLQILLTADQDFSLVFDVRNPIQTMEVSGSKENSLLYENLRFEETYQANYQPLRAQLSAYPEGSEQYTAIAQQLTEMVDARRAHIEGYRKNHPDAFFTKFKLAGQNPPIPEPRKPDGTIDQELQSYLYTNAYWDDMDFTDERLLNTPVYSNKLKTFFERIVAQQPDSIIKYADMVTRRSMANDSLFKFTANWIGVKYKEPSFMGADAVYVHMVQNFFTPELAHWAPEYELQALQQDAGIRASSILGVQAQQLDVKDENDLPISLLDTDSEIIVLYIYTPECENCQKETPLVLDVYRKWKNRGVDVFALCTAPDAEVCKKYIRANNLDWRNGIDPSVESNYTFKYHIDITPEIYVIDRDRTIVGKDLKAFQLETIFGREFSNQ